MADEYRVVVAWAEDKAARDKIVNRAVSLGVTYAADGPLFYAHCNLTKTKDLEALVAAEPKLHRMNAVHTAQNTAGFLGVADGIGTQPWAVQVGTPAPDIRIDIAKSKAEQIEKLANDIQAL